VTLDNEPRDTNDSNPGEPGPDAAVSAAGQDAAEPVAAPRRRASRARTTKKTAAAPDPAASSTPVSDDTPAVDAGASARPESAPSTGTTGSDDDPAGQSPPPAKRVRAPRKRTAPRAAARAAAEESPVEPATTAADLSTRATADALASVAGTEGAASPSTGQPDVLFGELEPASEPVKKTTRRRSRKAAVAEPVADVPAVDPAADTDAAGPSDLQPAVTTSAPTAVPVVSASAPPQPPAAAEIPAPIRAIMPLFQAPEPVAPRARRAASRPAGPPKAPIVEEPEAVVVEDVEPVDVELEENGESVEDSPDVESGLLIEVDDLVEDLVEDDEEDEESTDSEGSTPRRRRRRGGRGRRGRGRTDAEAGEEEAAEEQPVEVAAGPDEDEEAPVEAIGDTEDDEAEESAGESSGSRRRRRRRRRGAGSADGEAVVVEESARVVTRVRESSRDDVTAIRGSTRLEAKKQRRREGREAGRRKSILTEAEFLTRRESVDRVMVVREREGRTQIGVLEDNVLVEHYVARKTQTSTVGNVYLGRVQNVLPSMEAAFIDIGKGRNAVLYAGEVNWDAAGLDGQPRRIEHALKAGEAVLVQVTKDPIGHKGARLTSQISMPGRYLVYVPDGSMTGISRKLPDTERSRLKKILREIVPDDAGVIVRTAAEGASDEELERDVARLRAQWEDISAKIKTVQAPAVLYGEPDLAIKVVRDIFNEDFAKLIVSGDDAWETLQGYVSHVAPDLESRLERWTSDEDVFAAHRIDEQLAKGMDRKVWLPSGGSLVIDRTEAMTVVDVNTGKFVGAGGNLEETVTKNNLEAAEEVVHQLRLRDIGGIIVVDFIDMVLESNRDLVLRRLLECLGRDRTRHQVAEVTSLGLVQMTRKRVGQGLLEVFSETCEHCGGRGLIIHDEPVEKKQPELSMSSGGGGNGNRGKGRH
jgi:ribonuclease E